MTRSAGFIVCSLMLAISEKAVAQVQLGDLSTNLSGNISGGYTADFGNLGGSDHGFTAGGNASLAGYYYSPNFLSFNILPFYNQSRTNSDFQSILASSGVTASTALFSGSSFPGTIGYSRIFNSSGNFGVPGVANYTSYGDSQTFNVGWSENLSNLPHVSIGYQQGNNDYTLYGATNEGYNSFRSVFANVTYQIAGFNLTGNYRLSLIQIQTPEILESVTPTKAHSDTNSYSVGIGHPLPFNGSFSASASRSDLSLDSTTSNYSGTLDSLAAGMSFAPEQNLHFGANAQYLDNLLGSLYEPIVAAGGTIPQNSLPETSTHSLDINGYGNYEMPSLHLTFTAVDDHRDQVFYGQSLSSNSISGFTTYSNELWGGFLNATGGLTRTTINPTHSGTLGGLGTVNYQRPVGRWKAAGTVNYAMNQQTLLVAYTTSSYGYSGSLSRKFSRTSTWTNVASGSKSELNGQSGSGSFAQSYASSYNMRWLSVSGTFTRSSGNSVLTPSGLSSPSTLLPVVGGTSVILYGGHAYSASIGANPRHGLTLAASYSSAVSNTTQTSASSFNTTKLLYARVVYLVRKVYFQAGYTRLDQSFSGSGGLPVVASSLYVGLSRWFNFF